MDAFVARQPIFDTRKKLYAYELLFRDGLSNYMPDVEGDVATSKLLSSTFYTIGIDKITGGRRAFINFTEKLLLEEIPLLFPRETTVVEILEDVSPSDAILAAGRKLASNGYLLALDDFVFDPALRPLMALANIIKIDFRLTPRSEIETYLTRDHIKGVKLLAEKVETNEEFDQALQMGFHYFQGYFFSKPEIIRGKEISGSQFRLLEIIAKVNQSDFQFEEVENLVQRELSISYKLLRYINSAFFQLKKEITSIKQALVYLGQDEIRRFVSLIALSMVTPDKPNELIRSCYFRARFCELLSDVGSGAENAEELFILGLFSNIDAVLDQPMEKIMSRLPLSPKIIRALTDQSGTFGHYLSIAKGYEAGDWPAVSRAAARLGIEETEIPLVYAQSCEWANALAEE